MVIKIAILGAGISGLTAAWYLKKRFGEEIRLSIFEKKDRVGGWIQSSCLEGFFFENGPHSLRISDHSETLELIRELGLEEELLFANERGKDRFLLYQGHLEAFPNNFRAFFASPWAKMCIKAVIHELFAPRGRMDDESIYNFFSRRCSPSIADQFIDPLIKGIYGGDPKTLSMRMCFPEVWKLEETSRSLLWGMFYRNVRSKKTPQKVITLKNGLSQLPMVLAKHFEKEIFLNYPTSKLLWNDLQSSFDYVISTIPSYALAELLEESDLRNLLQQIPFASLAIIHLGYKEGPFLPNGFGYLASSQERTDILGAIFDSKIFPEQNRHPGQIRLTVIVGGKLIEKGIEACIDLAKKAVGRHLGINHQPEVQQGYIANKAIPQYPVGFYKWMHSIEMERKKIPSLLLLGASFHGVSVGQCIAHAKYLVKTSQFSR